ncbi:MAG: hypothetical protein PHE52_00745 [Candidatus Pacebacteria bacterium]|nr:hypothetical protein [Candidatus Paceibacterota bacterium]
MFKVTLDTHIVTALPGQTITVPLLVGLIHGAATPITLTVTDWTSVGIVAFVDPRVVTPNPQGIMSSLTIRLPLGIKDGTYLFTVRGETGGTFETSVDSVSVVINSKAQQRPVQQNAPQARQGTAGGRTRSGSPSLDLDNLFTPQRNESAPSESKAAPKAPKPNQKAINLIVFIMAIIIISIVLAANGVFDIFNGGGGGGGGSNCPTTCPGGMGVVIPQSCKCPSACPYTYIQDVGNGFKECASIPPR